MAERTFDDFDAYAKDYRAVHTENVKLSGADSFYFAEMKVALLKLYETDKPIHILDIGCGDGATELFMQKYFSQWQVKGIDVSEKSIAAAKEKQLSNTDFQIYNGTVIPFADQSFDVIFIAGVLHHVDFMLHQNIMQEVYRVLKTGGRLYLFEHNPLNPLTRYLVNTCVFDKDAKLLPNNYTKRVIREGSLEINNNKFIIFFPRKGILSKLIFLEKYLQWLPFGGQYYIQAIKK